MKKDMLLGMLLAGMLSVPAVAGAYHIHAFPSIDRPDKDLILIQDDFKRDKEKDTKYIFTDGRVGYPLDFLKPGGNRGDERLYFYVPAQGGQPSRIMRLENKSGMFSSTRAFQLSEYTAAEDKQVPMFLQVLDECYKKTFGE